MKFVSRSEWGARPPRSRTPGNAKKLAIHWEGPHMGTPKHEDCARLVRGIQNFHMDVAEPPDHFSDIAYNALVCPHGFVFEGRGRDVRTGANGGSPQNSTHYAVCYLGGEGDVFTPEAKDGFNDAAEFLGITDDAWVGHRDLTATSCPGDEIQKWVVEEKHPRSNVIKKENKLTQQEKDTLNFIAQVLTELKGFYARFDPQGQNDFFRGMEEAARLIKVSASA